VKGCKRGKEINGFQEGRFSLGILTHQQKDFPGKVKVQPGKIPEISE
jgi:hypothetical protein